jgi:hypothetical protein
MTTGSGPRKREKAIWRMPKIGSTRPELAYSSA